MLHDPIINQAYPLNSVSEQYFLVLVPKKAEKETSVMNLECRILVCAWLLWCTSRLHIASPLA